jgi:hypothetical protein
VATSFDLRHQTASKSFCLARAADHRSTCSSLGQAHWLRPEAYGYSFDCGRGATIRFAQGVDVLVHEVVDADAIRARPTYPANREAMEAVIAHHTTPEQAGEVFSRVKPRLAVYSHAPNSEAVLTQTRKTYAGPLQGPEDMLTIEIGEKIEVRHFAR